ncbi:hypothetical protein BH23ACT2_BH23ACT2_08680 [soil metagenome]
MASSVRYRCASCGNLTRFEVTSTRRTRAYQHYTVGGELDVEDEQVLDETVESVECRWCGAAGRVEELPLEAPSSTEG